MNFPVLFQIMKNISILHFGHGLTVCVWCWWESLKWMTECCKPGVPQMDWSSLGYYLSLLASLSTWCTLSDHLPCLDVMSYKCRKLSLINQLACWEPLLCSGDLSSFLSLPSLMWCWSLMRLWVQSHPPCSPLGPWPLYTICQACGSLCTEAWLWPHRVRLLFLTVWSLQQPKLTKLQHLP